jgi:hypothetical protein
MPRKSGGESVFSQMDSHRGVGNSARWQGNSRVSNLFLAEGRSGRHRQLAGQAIRYIHPFWSSNSHSQGNRLVARQPEDVAIHSN